MRASKRSLKGLLVLLVLATMIVPGLASAAAPNPVSDVIVFGNKVPAFAPWGVNGDPGWNDAVMGYNTVFANSKPLDQVSLGGVYYMGVADPDTIVDIEFTDGANTFSTSTWTAPTGSTVAIDGYNAGWFGLWVPSGFPRPTQDDNNVIYVTHLGVHKAETDLTINPDGAASTNPAHWGPSTITFKFTARNPATNEVSATVTRQITKYAGTPDDVTNVSLKTNIQYPPEHWCHTSGRGANDPFFGATLGGQQNGKCSDIAFGSPFPAVPDLTWLFCTRELSQPHQLPDQILPGVIPANPITGSANPFRPFYCGQSVINGGSAKPPSAFTTTGEQAVQGVLTDAPFGARGLSSEIASMTMQVFRGADLWLNLTPKMTDFRVGPTYGFSYTLKISDFEPNWPTGELYQVRISVQDAWGHVLNLTSDDITVYPY